MVNLFSEKTVIFKVAPNFMTFWLLEGGADPNLNILKIKHLVKPRVTELGTNYLVTSLIYFKGASIELKGGGGAMVFFEVKFFFRFTAQQKFIWRQVVATLFFFYKNNIF